MAAALFKEHEIILPHQHSLEQYNSKEFLRSCDLVLAEVSYHSTGMGIELGWADFIGVPVMCVYKKGTTPSASLKQVSDSVTEYDTAADLLENLSLFIRNTD